MADDLARYRADVAREWADSVRDAAAKLRGIELACIELSQRMDGLRACSLSASGNGPLYGDDAIAGIVSSFQDALDAYERMRARYAGEMEAFARAAARAGRMCEQYETVLKLRYLELNSWGETAAAIGVTRYYCSHGLRDAALAALYDCMPPSAKQPIPPAY